MEGNGRYINPYTDFGFKKLFGTEMNKDLLISFLNALFHGEKGEITDVQYLNGEHLGEGYGDRRSIFDVYCMTDDGSRFIVEMQKAEQEYFKDRSLYYSTAAIREQAEIAKYNSSERRQYEESQKEYWDYTSTLQTAEKKGRAEGRAEEKRDTARKLKAMGVLSCEQTAAATGLTIDEIKSL